MSKTFKTHSTANLHDIYTQNSCFKVTYLLYISFQHIEKVVR